MEQDDTSKRSLDNIVISLIFTMGYVLLVGIYEPMPLSEVSNFRLILFIVCSLICSLAAVYFAWRNYRKTKVASIILIIINSLGLVVPLIILSLLL